jgi:hypothetical protein
MEFFGIRLIWLNTSTAHKAILTVGFILAVVFVRMFPGWLARRVMSGRENGSSRFWIEQILSLTTATVIILGLCEFRMMRKHGAACRPNTPLMNSDYTYTLFMLRELQQSTPTFRFTTVEVIVQLL